MRIALKVAVISSGHSQREIAALAGLTENRMSAVVRGWVEPTPEERAALEQLLGVDDDAFRVVPMPTQVVGGHLVEVR